MAVTNVDNQDLKLKNNIELYFEKAMVTRKKRNICYTKDVMAAMLDKGSLFIIFFNLGYFGTMRFSEVKAKIRNISSRLLSVNLKKLENAGVVTRKMYAEVPPRVEYSLTPIGKEMTLKAIELNHWFLENFEVK